MIKRITLLGALVVALVFSAVPAAAITDGDLDGNGHPYVGLMVAQTAAGAPLWSRNYGSTANDVGFGVAVDRGGNVLVTGYFQGTINFGGAPLTSAGLTDGFLLNLGP